jgi:hypothetical protein
LLGLFFLFLSSSPIVLYTGVHHGRRVRCSRIWLAGEGSLCFLSKAHPCLFFVSPARTRSFPRVARRARRRRCTLHLRFRLFQCLLGLTFYCDRLQHRSLRP